ncbi:MAG: hypothetical protein HDS66_05845 [Bacteroidales bacterium]|nr:hypothetical protein [Bacteroidales bacterium]
MTPEELEALLTAAADPNTAPEALMTLREKTTALITTLNSAIEVNTKNEATIKDLQAQNLRMFLKSGSPVQTNEPEEPEMTQEQRDAEMSDYFSSLFGGKDEE